MRSFITCVPIYDKDEPGVPAGIVAAPGATFRDSVVAACGEMNAIASRSGGYATPEGEPPRTLMIVYEVPERVSRVMTAVEGDELVVRVASIRLDDGEQSQGEDGAKIPFLTRLLIDPIAGARGLVVV